MKVRALEKGYFGFLREVGEEFEVPDGAKIPWAEPVEAEKPAVPASKPRQGAAAKADKAAAGSGEPI